MKPLHIQTDEHLVSNLGNRSLQQARLARQKIDQLVVRKLLRLEVQLTRPSTAPGKELDRRSSS